MELKINIISEVAILIDPERYFEMFYSIELWSTA